MKYLVLKRAHLGNYRRKNVDITYMSYREVEKKPERVMDGESLLKKWVISCANPQLRVFWDHWTMQLVKPAECCGNSTCSKLFLSPFLKQFFSINPVLIYKWKPYKQVICICTPTLAGIFLMALNMNFNLLNQSIELYRSCSTYTCVHSNKKLVTLISREQSVKT